MITINQLLESIDLDFDPRWVTKDDDGVTVWAEKPTLTEDEYSTYWDACCEYATLERLKLSEFADKDWQECIYEVPRKTTGKLKHIERVDDSFVDKINAIIDAVSEINENYACIAALTDIRKRLDTLEKCVKNKRSEK